MLSTTGSCHHEEDMPAKAVARSITYPVGNVLRWKWVAFFRVVKSHEGWSHLSKHSWQPDTLFSSFKSDAPGWEDGEEIDSQPLLLTVGIVVIDNMFLLNQRGYFCVWFSFSLCSSPLASCEFLFPWYVESLLMGSIQLTKCYAVLFFITCVCHLSVRMRLC